MVDIKELKAEIVRNGLTQKQVYEGIGLSKRQWDSRIKSCKFDTDEMLDITKFIGIENPMPIFFADYVTCEVTKCQE